VSAQREAQPSEGPKGPSARDRWEADAPVAATRRWYQEAEA
jgi:hypothetical protein